MQKLPVYLAPPLPLSEFLTWQGAYIKRLSQDGSFITEAMSPGYKETCYLVHLNPPLTEALRQEIIEAISEHTGLEKRIVETWETIPPGVPQ